ncbi:hypothetical protein HY496_00085 [Candidatus Woesearchaeota archaeon]|nr:hypothetical protein [Candidatus Woesearchaeota archaeon]
MRVGAMVIDDSAIQELIVLIKQKKELRQISDDFVYRQLQTYFERFPARAEYLDNPRSQKYKKIVKEMRANLRKLYGLFRIEQRSNDQAEFLKMFARAKTAAEKRKVLDLLLSTHSSTKERLPSYEKMYRRLWQVTGTPASIIDLGCGLNPFSIPLMGLRKLRYAAFDLSMEEVALLHDFFTILHRRNRYFQGEAAVLDVLSLEELQKLPSANVCFLFKLTDVLDRGKGHTRTEKVLECLPCRFLVVSFATKTMSGKEMTSPRRPWMEWLCRRRGWKYTIIDLPGELFYVIEKEPR